MTRDGMPLVYLHRGGRSLVAFGGAIDDPGWVPELIGLVTSRRVKSLEIQKVNGEPVTAHPEIQETLLQGGFKPGYKGPTFRR